MAAGMPSQDTALKNFFKDNEVFASLFNGYFFDNREVVKAGELMPEDTAYAETAREKGKGKKKKVNRYRDITRRAPIGRLVILGIEGMSRVSYAYPVKVGIYDFLGYLSQIGGLVPTDLKGDWTIDDKLSEVEKGTKLTPIITLVFYTGEEPWDGPRSMYEMYDVEEGSETAAFMKRLDYPICVVDLGHDDGISFGSGYLEELRTLLRALYSGEKTNIDTEVTGSMVALAGILSGDQKLYNAGKRRKGDKQSMWKVLQERDERLIREKEKEFEEERKAFASERKTFASERKTFASKEKAFAKKEKKLEQENMEKDKLLAEQSARISELEAKIAAMGAV